MIADAATVAFCLLLIAAYATPGVLIALLSVAAWQKWGRR